MLTISVNSKDLKNALALCAKVAPKRSILPVLQNVLISVTMQEGVQFLRLFCTDLETGVLITLPCTVSPDCFVGDITSVSVASFAQATKTAKGNNDVTLTLDPTKAAFTVNGFKVLTIDPAEFPPVPTADPTIIAVNLSTGFAQAVNKVAFCASDDDARPVLKGVHITSNNTGLTLEAADGFILSRRILPYNNTPPGIDINIGAKALTLFAQIARAPSGAPTLTIDKTHGRIMLSCDNTTVVAAIIDGNYPDIDQVIPKGVQTTTVLNVAELKAACEKIVTLAKLDPDNKGNSKNNQNPGAVVLELGKGEAVQTGWRLVSSAWDNTTTPLVTYLHALSDGNNITIGFNAEWLLQALNTFVGDTCTLETSIDSAPGAFKFDNNGLFLLMPICLTDIAKVITPERETLVPGDVYKVAQVVDANEPF